MDRWGPVLRDRGFCLIKSSFFSRKPSLVWEASLRFSRYFHVIFTLFPRYFHVKVGIAYLYEQGRGTLCASQARTLCSQAARQKHLEIRLDPKIRLWWGLFCSYVGRACGAQGRVDRGGLSRARKLRRSAKFSIFKYKFLVFNTQFLVLNADFNIFAPRERGRPLWSQRWKHT